MKNKKHSHKRHNKNELDRDRKNEENFDFKIKTEPLSDEENHYRRERNTHARSKRRSLSSEDHSPQNLHTKSKDQSLSDEDRLPYKTERDSHSRSKRRSSSHDDRHPSDRRDKGTHVRSSSRHHPYEPSNGHHSRDSPEQWFSRKNGYTIKDHSNHRNKHHRSEIKEEQHSDYEWGKKEVKIEGQKKDLPINKAKPDFGLSGKLAEETNTYNGVVIKYSEPPEARKPKRRWRFYPFKGDQGLPTLYIHRQSAYLIGRDRKIADIPIDHPSCSKQHAVLQYRLVPFTRDNGTTGKRVLPYIIDLESANGTYVNNNKMEAKKYVQLMEKDVLKFGYSSREYVLLHDHSKDSDQDGEMSC